MVDSVKKDREREKLADGKHTQNQTIINKIAWNSFLGIIIGEGRMRLA